MSTSTPQSHERFGGDARITSAMEDYLKGIYRLEQEGDTVSTQRLAEEMQLSGASVSNMVKRLDDLKLLVHNRYRGVSLTPSGRAVALEVIRHHRLLELYLSQALGLDIDQVHKEADRLEHHLSEELEARMEQVLGFPEFDPHGHPIPSRTGAMSPVVDIVLTQLADGETAVVSRVSDRDPDHLREIDDLQIRPGTPITITHHQADGIHASLSGGNVIIPEVVAELIHVVPTTPRSGT